MSVTKTSDQGFQVDFKQTVVKDKQEINDLNISFDDDSFTIRIGGNNDGDVFSNIAKGAKDMKVSFNY